MRSLVLFLILFFIGAFLSSCSMPVRGGYNRSSGSYAQPQNASKSEQHASARNSDSTERKTQGIESQGAESQGAENSKPVNPANQTSSWEKAAAPWLGTPYLYSGSTKKGIDCSGFVMQMYKQVRQISLPHNAAKIYEKSEKISKSSLREGDLVFFGGFWSVDHVGIYLEGNRFVHASSSKGVVITPLNNSYWKKRFKGAGRIK